MWYFYLDTDTGHWVVECVGDDGSFNLCDRHSALELSAKLNEYVIKLQRNLQ